ncbi:hypothetical protein [Desulfosporosinus sp. SB140]|uniref:hypothetical protein n=1 Tax=Desulfosporosinus paludis TaxID=3115649 RepID=UPI00388DFB04
MLQAFHSIFISIMDFLTNHFGYGGALRIKDISNDIAWCCVVAILLLIGLSHAFMITKKSNTVEDEVAVQKIDQDGVTVMQVNPKSAWDIVESLIGEVILLFSPETSIRFKTVKPIRIILFSIMIFFIIIGLFLSMWDYFPDGTKLPLPDGHQFSKHVGCLTIFDHSLIGNPIRSSSPTSPPALHLTTKQHFANYNQGGLSNG